MQALGNIIEQISLWIMQKNHKFLNHSKKKIRVLQKGSIDPLIINQKNQTKTRALFLLGEQAKMSNCNLIEGNLCQKYQFQVNIIRLSTVKRINQGQETLVIGDRDRSIDLSTGDN